MTLDELLSIQATIEKRAVPIDILEEEYTYYSKSKDEHINLLDLHLIHFIRIFLKLVEENNKSIDKDKLNKVRMTALDLLGDIHNIEQDME
jgi:hypothetical protein|tara:strand:+ start:1032 stop:1304 length:273 start_codon:yes stop_codon:yes gene_type:complete